MKILFVCTGNICRSPTAHAIARNRVKELGLENKIKIDSAGTTGFHAGESPDYRAVEVGSERGIDFSGIKSRPLTPNDFANFDLIFAMDQSHYNSMKAASPEIYYPKIHLFLKYAGIDNGNFEVKDPYYGGIAGFEKVFNLIEDGVEKILSDVANKI